MRRRRPREGATGLSLDSFLDIVTNVVGVLILVAVVTVLSAGDIAVSSGASAMSAPPKQAQRLVYQCVGDRLFVVDERGNSARVGELIEEYDPDSGFAVVDLLANNDVGDASYRVQARFVEGNELEWVYMLRYDSIGESAVQLEQRSSDFQTSLNKLEGRGFAYFVVHDDSFEVFRKAREIAHARGIAIGWHPVEGKAPLRLSANGSLGKRIQ